MQTLRGRTAVITGAASGLGLEFARLAAREGLQLVLADVQAEALERAAQGPVCVGRGFVRLDFIGVGAAVVEHGADGRQRALNMPAAC